MVKGIRPLEFEVDPPVQTTGASSLKQGRVRHLQSYWLMRWPIWGRCLTTAPRPLDRHHRPHLRAGLVDGMMLYPMSKIFNLAIPFDFLLQAIDKLSPAAQQYLRQCLAADADTATDQAILLP